MTRQIFISSVQKELQEFRNHQRLREQRSAAVTVLHGVPLRDSIMTLNYIKHEKLSLRKHPVLNERWLQDRIEEDPVILGLGGDLRLLDRERPLPGGGRLDVLLFDDENNRRFEVEIQLGATDPSHVVRCIEYWDLE